MHAMLWVLDEETPDGMMTLSVNTDANNRDMAGHFTRDTAGFRQARAALERQGVAEIWLRDTGTYAWTARERQQAEDRCHRIGQTRPVTYVDIVADGTIDTRIQAAIARKEDLAVAFRRRIDQVKDKSKAEVRKAIGELVREL